MKYKLRSDLKIEVYGRILYRIERISTGEVGGFIETEANLNQYDNAWVSDNAQVYGDARVYGDAQVYGDAVIDSLSAIIVLCIAMKYSVTITRKTIQVGCTLLQRAQIKSMTATKAEKLGLPKELFKGYKQMILGAMKLINEE